MTHENEVRTMNTPWVGSGGFSYTFASPESVKKSSSHVRYRHWMQLYLLVILLAGQASASFTSPAPSSLPTTVQTSVFYFLDVTVDVIGQKKNESEIIAWLQRVFQNNLEDCVVPNIVKTQQDATALSNTAESQSTLPTIQSNSTITAPKATTLQKPTIPSPSAATALQTQATTTAQGTTTTESKTNTTATATEFGSNNQTTTGLRNSSTSLLNTQLQQSRGMSPSGISGNTTTALFQGLEVSCSQKTAITKTTCAVTLQLTRAVSPCCVLRSLCAASKTSSDITAVANRADRLGQLHNECNLNPGEETSCVYTGPGPNSCEESGSSYVVQSNSTDCVLGNCNCSAFCSRSDAYYAFSIGIQDPTVDISQVSSLISTTIMSPCPPAEKVVCLSSSDASAFKNTSVACGSPSTNIQSCSVILQFVRNVPICAVATAMKNVFQSEDKITFNGLVHQAAICGKLGINDNPLQSHFIRINVGLKPANFCPSVQGFNNFTCSDNKNIAVFLDQNCDGNNFTEGQNTTTVQPSTIAMTTNVTSAPVDTTTPQPTTQGINTTTATLNTTMDRITPQITVQGTNTTTPTLNTTMDRTTSQITVQGTNATTSTPNITMDTTTPQPTTLSTTTTTSTPNTTVTTLNTTPTTQFTTTPHTPYTTTPDPTTQFTEATTSTPNTTMTTLITTTTEPTTAMSTTTTSAGTRVSTTLSTTALLPPNPRNTTTATVQTTETIVGTSTENLTTTATAENRATRLLELSRDVSNLNFSQVDELVSELERLLSGPSVSLDLGNTSIHIVSNLLGASPEQLTDVSSRITRIVDTVGLKLVINTQSETLLSPALSLSVKPADGMNFQETFFSIVDPSNVQVRGDIRFPRSVRTDSSIPQGSITLPSTLTQDLTTEEQQQLSRVQFNFYQKSTVYQDQFLGGDRRLNSGILGASVANLSITGLQDNVTINLRHIEPVPGNFVATCVFWDITLYGGSGGWSSDGCSVLNSTDNETICGCNHLTAFGILLNLSRQPITSRLQATILTFITYIGCGISAIFLSVTLLTYLAFGKLRKDIPSKILIQLCLALLLLNLVFLVDAWLALYPNAVGLCISTAWFLHYFLLATFTWMGLEAVHLYVALVKVFNTHMSHYMLRFSAVGWGVPMIVVIIVIAIDKDNYGLVSYGRFSDGSSDDFCWLKNDIAFYVAVVAYFCVIFLFNLAMFIVVLVQLYRIRRQNPHNNANRSTVQDVRSVAGITILLGLTWGFAFFAWGPVNLAFMYLFAIFNSLQGFFIFVFHCAVKENVRRQWRTYLCCGKLRLAENSDWSRTATTQKTTKRSSHLTSVHSSNGNNSSSSSSSLICHSPVQNSGIGNLIDEGIIPANESPPPDVVFNETTSTRHRHRHAS